MKLTAFLEEVFAPRRMVRESNLRQYVIQIRHFGRFLGREPELSDLTDDLVSRFLLTFARTRSTPTVNKARTHLLAMWRYAARKRLVTEFPDVLKLPEPQRVPQAWTLDQLRALFAAAARMHGRYGPVPAPTWWSVFLRFLFETGERASAALSLRWDWIDLQTGRVVIPAEERKGRRKDGLYWLRPATLELLRAMPREGDRVFPFPLCMCSYYLHWAKLLRLAGLPVSRSSKTQKMRRSFASHLEAAGGDATKALLHEDRGTTARHYLDPAVVGAAPAWRSLPDVG